MLITSVLFMLVSLVIVFGITGPIIKQERVAYNLWNSKQSYYLSEAGTEDVIYRVKSYSDSAVQSSETLSLGNFNAITNISGSSGDVGGLTVTTQSNQNDYDKYIQTTLKKGPGVSFYYGLQTGNGGFVFNNSGTIIGNVYSNGNIISNNSSAKITGMAIAANGGNVFLDQSNTIPDSPPSSIPFGNNYSTQDLAQSFVLSSSSPVNQISVYIKKIGSPSDATLKIVKDSSGSPSASSGDILATLTLSSLSVGADYSWTEVYLPNSLSLSTSSTYWLVFDASRNTSNYYIVGSNLDNSYLNGTAKSGYNVGPWSNTGSDIYFKIYSGDSFGKIMGVNQYNLFNISGGAYAHYVSSVNSGGVLKCKAGVTNNKSCDTSSDDPVQTPYPVATSSIQGWKDAAAVGGTINSDFTTDTYSTYYLGPKKINGNLVIGGSATVVVTGTIWVTGDLIMSGASRLILSPTYGTNSGMIVLDGKISIGGSCIANGSGQTGSFIMLITTSDCPASSSCGGANAVEMYGSGGAVIINAENGTINLNGSAYANEITGKKVVISGGGVTVTYNTGLVSPSFSNGPSGSFNITGWRELEQY